MLLSHDWSQWFGRNLLGFVVSPKATPAIQVLIVHSYFPPTFDQKYAHRKTKRQVLQDFDFIGLVLLVGGLLIFLMGISWGGSLYPWKSAHVSNPFFCPYLKLLLLCFRGCFISRLATGSLLPSIIRC